MPQQTLTPVSKCLLKVVNECLAKSCRELGYQADCRGNCKDEIVCENYVEISKPLQPAEIAKQIEIGNTCLKIRQLRSTLLQLWVKQTIFLIINLFS